LPWHRDQRRSFGTKCQQAGQKWESRGYQTERLLHAAILPQGGKPDNTIGHPEKAHMEIAAGMQQVLQLVDNARRMTACFPPLLVGCIAPFAIFQRPSVEIGLGVG
jgi:hypothetical protein